MQILKRGAEAVLSIDELDGKKVLIKERIKKNYRIPQIDLELRKTRTKREIRLLTEARKIGVNTPAILETSENKIVMELIDGETAKEFLNHASEKEIKKVCEEIGEDIGKLHSIGIVHGDLTTSNMIISNEKIYFIDFGLGSFSKRIEDQGVDLNLLVGALRSTHFKIIKICWSSIIRGYRKAYPRYKEVLDKVEEIEKRARYMKR